MKLSELREASFNPRFMSDAQLEVLRGNLSSLGDLGGIIFNRRSGNLVGGHQRVRALKENSPDIDVTIEEQLTEPNTHGTVARGFILHEGEKFAYREVDWDEQTERIANIAANNVHGTWDIPKLEELVKGLSSEIDISELAQTGFSQEVLAAITNGSANIEQVLRLNEIGRLGITLPEPLNGDIGTPGDLLLQEMPEEKELDENIPTAHTCPKCGYKFS